MQDCLFPNLGIFRNMKLINVSWYSIPWKTYRLREVDATTRNLLVMSLCLIKDMSKFHVFIYKISQKYDPKQKEIFHIKKKINLKFVMWIAWSLNTWRYGEEEKNFHLLQLIVFDIMRILLAISYFSTYSEIWSPPNFPLVRGRSLDGFCCFQKLWSTSLAAGNIGDC